MELLLRKITSQPDFFYANGNDDGLKALTRGAYTDTTHDIFQIALLQAIFTEAHYKGHSSEIELKIDFP